jgi:hypothetical protein
VPMSTTRKPRALDVVSAIQTALLLVVGLAQALLLLLLVSGKSRSRPSSIHYPGEAPVVVFSVTDGFMSVVGRVSRALHELSAARNCTRDEGGPFEFGDQEPISSHRKLQRAKAVVVSVAETPGQDFGRHGRERRAQANRCRSVESGFRRCQNRGVTLPPGSARGMP